jgi:hypothetical protein
MEFFVMKRPLSLVLAAALVASTMAVSVAPAAAHFGVTIGTGGWDNDRWHDDGYRYRHHRRDNFVAPGFSFNFGVPDQQPRAYYHHRRHHRDCFRNDYDELVCRN